jgi:integrase
MAIKIKLRIKIATNSKGTKYYYHRATMTRLPGKFGSPEMIAAYWEIERGAGPKIVTKAPTKTVAWLIRQYEQSKAFRSLAESTRKIMVLNLKAVEREWGDIPLEIAAQSKERPTYRKWHEKLAETHPRAADAKMAALSRVFAFGVDDAHISGNPIERFKHAWHVDRSDKIWEPRHIEVFGAGASSAMFAALMLALHTGQRRGDLLKLKWSDFDGENFRVVQGKASRSGRPAKPLIVPATASLRAFLETLPRTSPYILTNPVDGAPWSRDAFASQWDAAFKNSGITDDLHFHDLRGTAVTMLAEAGCTVPQIASITGHSAPTATKIIGRYLSTTVNLAQQAIEKLNSHTRNTIFGNTFGNTPKNEDETK